MKLLSTALICTAFCLAGEVKLGRALESKDTLSIEQVLSSPAQYIGKTIQVRGKITEVCQAMGCWMSLTDDAGRLLRVNAKHDGPLVFPKDSAGKIAIAEGQFGKEELTKDEAIAAARHEAAENGRTFDPASIKSGKVVYQIAGAGAVIFEN